MCSQMRIPIFDGHNDTLKSMYLKGLDFLEYNNEGHLDLKRAVETNWTGGFFSIFTIPERKEEREYGYGLTFSANGWEVEYGSCVSQAYAGKFTDDILKYAVDITKRSDRVRIVTSYSQLLNNIKKNIISIIIHFEGAEAIHKDLSNLEQYYEKGLRSLGLVWSRANEFGWGAPFKFPGTPDIGPGLTAEGRGLVKRCNELGILIDLAHMNLKGFFDAAKLSCAPIVVTHAGVNKICPSSTNLLDEQLSVIKETSGIAGILFDIVNTRSDGQYVEDTPAETVVQHINYIADKFGVDYVGLGSDFDGAQMPLAIRDVAGERRVLELLKKQGYSTGEIEKIAYKNWMRVLKATWR